MYFAGCSLYVNFKNYIDDFFLDCSYQNAHMACLHWHTTNRPKSYILLGGHSRKMNDKTGGDIAENE